jgi:hypothetical protein
MILYEWMGKDGARYRMANGGDAQHPMMAGQAWEMQRSEFGRFWIPMVDYNAGVREPKGAPE